MQFLDAVKDLAKSDRQLSAMLSIAAEYAEIYLLAKQRQKGCDGMGEAATLKDEFKNIVDELIKYCRTKGYLQEDISYDIDLITDAYKEGKYVTP